MGDPYNAERPMTKELIVSGYRSQHTALLARTALSREQDELSLSSQGIAVVSRGRSQQHKTNGRTGTVGFDRHQFPEYRAYL
jgi:hypothetical protein